MLEYTAFPFTAGEQDTSARSGSSENDPFSYETQRSSGHPSEASYST